MQMCPTPTKYFISAGSAEGWTPLNAFDGALLNSKVGNTNIVHMSSIVPPNCQFVESIDLPYGALVPTAYSSKISQIPGDIITASIAVGIPKDNTKPGLIMEYSASSHKKEAEEIVKNMVIEGLKIRNEEIKEIKVISATHKVEHTGAVFACCVLWY